MAAEVYGRMAASVIEGLKKRNMEGFYCETKEQAIDLVMDLVEKGAKVSWGGSETVKQLGLLDRLKEAGCEMVEYPDTEKREMGSPAYPKVVNSDYFLMGTNAVTVKGELVNIDGASNRVACLLHGPKHVVIVVGINKIVRTVEDGIDRIQTQTCPVISEKTGRKTPCSIKGICADCQSPDCMCCSIVVTRRSRYTGRIKVVIVGENLGI